MKQALFIILGIVLTFNIKAQVTIGSNNTPVSGALLQLKETSTNGDNSTRGLSMPRVELKSLSGDLAESMGAPSGTYDAPSHIGLLVYNTGVNDNTSSAARICQGMHVWTGEQWEPLIPYPSITRKEIFDAYTSGEFYYLDPSSPNDESWKFINKNASDYNPLGAISTVSDIDGNTYTTSRFYVGFFRRWSRYKVQENYSCDPEKPIWVDQPDVLKFTDTFEDGVWMTQNLKVKNFDTTRDDPSETSIITLSQAKEAITDPTLAKWEYPNKDSSNESSMGLLYTWAAAANGNTGTNYDLEVLEGKRIQGICPKGWHLPSDRQWTDLENALIIKSTLFTDPQISIADPTILAYWSADTDRGEHSSILRGNTSGSGGNQGKSKTAATGGFDAYDTGFIDNGVITFYGVGSGWWSSSHIDGKQAERRAVFNQSQISWMNSKNVYRDSVNRNLMLGIRCMKNTD